MSLNSPDLIVIGASWGGLSAISTILNFLPREFPIPVVLAQHQHANSDNSLVKVLSVKTALNIVLVEPFTEIKGNTVYVIPPNYHGLIEDKNTISLNTDELVHYSRPAIDILFETAADKFGEGLVGIVLTGANEDGSEGLLRIKQRGGVTVVQDPEEAEVDVMPRSALNLVNPDYVMKLDEIGELVKCFGL